MGYGHPLPQPARNAGGIRFRVGMSRTTATLSERAQVAVEVTRLKGAVGMGAASRLLRDSSSV